MTNNLRIASDYKKAIRDSGYSIYDTIEIDDPELWIPTPTLEQILNDSLLNISVAGMPVRTRSKFVKEHVCQALGYPIPPSFRRTQPRFLGQDFDCYVQKSDNFQVFNEELSPNRRYVIVRIGSNDTITKVKVVTGEALALLDTTGTETLKYQARLGQFTKEESELISAQDTDRLKDFTSETVDLSRPTSPVDHPRVRQLLSIRAVYDRLRTIVGASFPDPGSDQERNRGAALHHLVCKHLGYTNYRDSGQFPDVPHQLLEVKLQTSPTIDLGRIRPDNGEPLNVPMIEGQRIRHCDVRYALFYGTTDGGTVIITHFFLSTGEAFFNRFSLMGGNVINKKIQISFPQNFFDY